MRTPTAVLDLEISGKFTELNDIGDFVGALVLFRLHGRPLGWGAASVTDGGLDRGALVRQLLEQHAWSCALPLAERAVLSGIPPRAIDVGSMLLSQPSSPSSGPLVTVAVCSRTPAAELQPCLDSLIALDYASIDRVLVDASDDRQRVEALVKDHYPAIRYVAAPAGAASRQAIAECRGDVLALTHGDAVVDRRWVSRLVAVFLADPDVMTVTGMTLPRSIGRPMRDVLPPVHHSAASGRALTRTRARAPARSRHCSNGLAPTSRSGSRARPCPVRIRMSSSQRQSSVLPQRRRPRSLPRAECR